MRTLITRSLLLHLPSARSLPSPPLRSCIFLIHTAGGDEPYRQRFESFSSSSSPLSPIRRQHEEESRAIKVSVWWDFENCNIPVGVNVFRVASRISNALRSSGIKGPITINAFGDVAQLSRSTQEALTATGVCLTHVPHSGKNSSDKSFMADLVYWVSQNPPPVHFFLISGDADFANILHRLRMSNYNILLSSTDCTSGVLGSAATIMWPWYGLVRGEDVTIKRFNHPPDGTYGSWYGHYKGPLDEPFPHPEQTAASQPEESMQLISEVKPRPIPKPVVSGIRQVLHSYPEGINLSELRSELRRNNIIMDKDFFGHRKFSNLLSSLTGILKFIPSGEGQPRVIATRRKVAEPVKPSSKPAKESETGEEGQASTQSEKPSQSAQITIAEPSFCCKVTDADAIANSGTLTSREGEDPGMEVRMSEESRRALADPQSNTDDSSLNDKETDKDTAVYASTSLKGHNVAVEEGFFWRIWRRLVGSDAGHSVERNDIVSDTGPAIQAAKQIQNVQNAYHSEEIKPEEKAKSKSLPSPVNGSISFDASNSLRQNKANEQSDKINDLHDQRMGFFNQIASQWNFWKSGDRGVGGHLISVKEVMHSQPSDIGGPCANALTHSNCQPETHDLFSKPYFWYALKSFLRTEKVSDLIHKSETREQLICVLRNEFPFTKNLKDSHFLHLVDLLISDKKWVEESASEMFPFKLVLPSQESCAPLNSHGSNGLRSLFTGKASKSKASQSNLHRQLQQENHDYNFEPLQNVDGCLVKTPQNIAELKAWFESIYNGREHIEPEGFQRLFETKFNKKLVCNLYGHSSIQNLLKVCLNVADSNQEKRKSPSSREEILSDCHKLLTELCQENPERFYMSSFKSRFIEKYGYFLDYKMLGYPKLVSLLQIMPGIRIEFPYILPAAKFPSGDCPEKHPNNGTFTDSFEELGRVVSSAQGDTSNNKDSVREELGSESNTVTYESNCINQGKDKEVSFEKASISEEEFSDSDDESLSPFVGSERQGRRGEEHSSLLQILDSWYIAKEDSENRPLQTADGLVDCSRSNALKSSDNKPADLQKPKVKLPKHFSFVLDSGESEKKKLTEKEKLSEKGKLIESILGSLKNEGDSRLQMQKSYSGIVGYISIIFGSSS